MGTKAIIVAASIAALSGSAYAADLGGNCCADLEERIAELEATVARKGTKKVSLTISGQVSKAVLIHDIDGIAGKNKAVVIDNPNDPTKVRLVAEGKITTHMSAGAIVEYGFAETNGAGLGPVGPFIVPSYELRRSAVWLDTIAGRVTIGKYNIASDGTAFLDPSNSNIASRAMSFEPIWSYIGIGAIPVIGPLVNPAPFTDLRAQVVRYDSPDLWGFSLAGSWGAGQTLSGDDMWDVALRFARELGGFQLMAGAGYKVESYKAFNLTDAKTRTASAGGKHIDTGLFVALGYADVRDHLLFQDFRMMQARAGIERNWFGFGATTIFAEVARHEFQTWDANTKIWGMGIVQAVNPGGLDVFLDYKKTTGDVIDYSTVMAGARVRF